MYQQRSNPHLQTSPEQVFDVPYTLQTGIHIDKPRATSDNETNRTFKMSVNETVTSGQWVGVGAAVKTGEFRKNMLLSYRVSALFRGPIDNLMCVVCDIDNLANGDPYDKFFTTNDPFFRPTFFGGYTNGPTIHAEGAMYVDVQSTNDTQREFVVGVVGNVSAGGTINFGWLSISARLNHQLVSTFDPEK